MKQLNCSSIPSVRKTSLFKKSIQLTSVLCMGAMTSTNIVAGNNDALEAAIAVLIGTHNTALPVSLTPVPGVSDAADLVTYGTNIGLKYIKAPFEAPANRGVMPNSADMCSYRMTLPQSEAEYKNLLGAWDIQKLPTSWGPLGAPTVSHANSDVTVSVDNLGSVPFARTTNLQTTVFPAGHHYLQWTAETQISPTFDIILPLAVYGLNYVRYGKAVTSIADTSATQAAKQGKFQRNVQEVLENIAIELGLISADILTENGIVAVTHADSEHIQQFSVFDVHPPELSTDFPVLSLEATDFGGVNYERVKEQILASINASDPCGRQFSLSSDAPALFPLGDTPLTWTAKDSGPTPSYGVNTTTLEQTVVVQDTQAPIMVPPAGRVIETAGNGLQSSEVELGFPRVVDLADSNPSVSNDVPDFFPLNSRTEVLWRATDASNNSAESSQLITVKQAGTNTTPTAQAKSASTLTSEPVEIVLTGVDNDIIDSRADPLSFSITQQPANGEFIAPLYPFFIEDYRTQPQGPFGEEFLLASPRSKYVFDNFCSPDNVPWDGVYEPIFMHVTDDGTQFIFDYYWTCNTSSSVGQTKPRVSKWDRDGNYLGQASMNSNTNEQFVLDRDGFIYFTDRVGSGSSTDLFLKRCSTNFGTNSTQCDTSWKFNSSSAPEISPGSLVYARVDSQRGLAFVTDKRRVFAFDIRQGGGDSEYLGALFGGEQFLTSCTAVSSRAGFTIEIDSESNLYVADSCADKIHKFEASEFDSSGNFVAGDYVGWLGKCDTSTNKACDDSKGRSKGYSCTDTTCLVSESKGSEQGQFSIPLHLALDPNDVLYVADYANRRIQRFSPDGSFAGEAVSTGTGVNQGDEPGFILGNFDSPKTVSVNSTQFFIVDQAESFVHVFETSPLKDITDSSATVTYVSDFSFHSAQDSFTYSVSDGLATSEPALVSVGVSRNYRAPVVTPQSFSGIEDGTVQMILTGDDPDGVIGSGDFNALDTLSFVIDEQPNHGSVTGSGSTFTYTPEPNFNGIDSFTYIAHDGVLDSEPATVDLTISDVNDPPVVDSLELGNPAVGFPFGLVANFRDDNLDPSLTNQHSVTISWGDGTTSARGELDDGNALVIAPINESVSGVITANHVYTSTGTKQVSVCVTDERGAQTCESSEIEVAVRASLAMGIMASAEEISVGDAVSYQVELLNLEPTVAAGTQVASNVVATHELPQGLALESVDNSEGSCTISGNQVSCTLGDMSPGDSVSMTINAINDGSVIFNTEDDFNVVAMTNSPATKDFYLGFALTSILADGTDADNDGIFDVFELAYGLDPSSDDSLLDLDGDGLTNLAEFIAGTAANDADSDKDGITDAWEIEFGLNPLKAGDADFDSDKDGFSNLDEFLADRDPLNDEQSGNRLVPVLSVYDNSFLTVPGVQIGSDFYDFEMEVASLNPVVFELIAFTKRDIKLAVPDTNFFDLGDNTLNVSVAEVLGELYSLKFLLVNDSPIELQLTEAGATSVTP